MAKPVLSGCLLLLLGLATGCNQPVSQQPPKPPPPEVLVTSPLLAEVTDYEYFTGRSEASEAVDVRARVTGYLMKLNFKDGDLVKQGQELFEIDRRPYEAALAQAKANQAQTEARLNRLSNDYRRIMSLRDRNVVSPEELDRIVGERNEAEAAVKAAQASVDIATLNLSFTSVSAPISGRVSRHLIDAGNLVKSDETVLTSIVRIDPVHAYFDLDERTSLRLQGVVSEARKGMLRVRMGLAVDDGFPHEGLIDFVDNRVDSGTGTLRMRAVFDNKAGVLAPGLFVRVRMATGTPRQALLLPERGLGSDQGQKFVYVVQADKKIAERRVTLGAQPNEARLVVGGRLAAEPTALGGMRIVEQGIAAEDQIVVSGLQRVRRGVEVRVMPVTIHLADGSPVLPKSKPAQP